MRLHPVSRSDLIRRLRELGWDGPHSGGRHEYMIKGEMRLFVPNPHGSSIGPPLLTTILREGGICRNEWLNESRPIHARQCPPMATPCRDAATTQSNLPKPNVIPREP
ncbi:MAG: type II toxin-antitoxin system HicA family toxin [Opitutales bacterium]